MNPTRRDWLSACLAIAAWPQVSAAREHAQHAVSSASRHFDNIDGDAAAEVEALAAQIIPSVDGPGAREAGVVYFIDRALGSFAADDRAAFLSGLEETQKKRKALFPNSTSVAALTDEQQMALLRSIETTPFFDQLRTYTVLGFLGDPSYGGNVDEIGWQAIGFDHQMAYQPPFGYYDAEARRKGEMQ